MVKKNKKEIKKVMIINCFFCLMLLLQSQAMEDGWDMEKKDCQNKSLIEMQSERKYNWKKAEDAWKREKGEMISDDPLPLSDTENSYHFNEGIKLQSYFG